MSIPPSMLKSLGREYRPEPFASSVERTASVVSHLSSGRAGVSWPVTKFDVTPKSSAELTSALFVSLVGLYLVANAIWHNGANGIRSGTMLGPLCLWILFDTLKTLRRKYSLDWYESVILEMDRLVHIRGHEQESKSIYFEQICTVKLRTVRAKPSLFDKENEWAEVGPIEVDYYLYDRQTGSLNLSRLRSIVLPKTDDDAGLYDEIRRRSFGPPPGPLARIGLAIRQYCLMALLLLALPLYLLGVAGVAAVSIALVT